MCVCVRRCVVQVSRALRTRFSSVTFMLYPQPFVFRHPCSSKRRMDIPSWMLPNAWLVSSPQAAQKTTEKAAPQLQQQAAVRLPPMRRPRRLKAAEFKRTTGRALRIAVGRSGGGAARGKIHVIDPKEVKRRQSHVATWSRFLATITSERHLPLQPHTMKEVVKAMKAKKYWGSQSRTSRS